MARAKKHPEIELPGIITKAITDYLGKPVLNRLDSASRTALMQIGLRIGQEVGQILEANGKPARKPVMRSVSRAPSSVEEA